MDYWSNEKNGWLIDSFLNYSICFLIWQQYVILLSEKYLPLLNFMFVMEMFWTDSKKITGK